MLHLPDTERLLPARNGRRDEERRGARLILRNVVGRLLQWL